MHDAELRGGDTVQVRSGGPLMTIERPAGAPGRFICVWFEKNTQKRGVFSAAVLKKVNGPVE